MMDFIKEINSDDEALAVLSVFGFTVADLSFINKTTSPMALVSSDLMRQLINGKIAKCPHIYQGLNKFRETLDRFYASGGFLLSAMAKPESRLFRFKEAPLIFYGRFNPELLDHRPAVAIVGSRSASSEALSMTKDLAATLAKHSINVVSGGAIGIDQAAHFGSLSTCGTTIMVSGVVAKPQLGRGFQDAWMRFKEGLLLIYPYGPFTPQKKYMFVERNRFVASLADRVIVVQGKRGSGTLHTANFAKKLAIPIVAIPGAINDPLSFAPNHLLATSSATALTDVEQLVEGLTTMAAKLNKKPAKKARERVTKPPSAKELPGILRVIHENNNMLNFDEIMHITGYPFTVLQRELLNYELAGRITKRGAQFVLTGN